MKGTKTKRTKERTDDPQEREPQKRLQSGDVLSSEIDIDEILRLAADVDEAAKDEPEPKRRGKTRVSSGKAMEPVVDAPPVEVIKPDPEFEAMIQWGVETGVDFAKIKLDWTEPGKHWREKVSLIIARMVQRIAPVQPGLMSDLITLAGYSALWIIPNIAVSTAVAEAEVVNRSEKAA